MADTNVPHTKKSYSCDLCEYTSTRVYNVTRHKLLKHKIQNTETLDKSTQTVDQMSGHQDIEETPDPVLGVATNTGTIATKETVASVSANNPAIITFKDNEYIDILSDHIDIRMARHIFNDAHNQRGVLRKYSQALLNRVENQCVKKTSTRYAQSQVHTGNNIWISRQDTDIYRTFATSIAQNMHGFIESRKGKRKYQEFDSIFKKLDKYVNYMADYGYINTDNKELKRSMLTDFRLFAKDVCIIVGNLKNK